MLINVIIDAPEGIRQKVIYGFTVLFTPLRVELNFSRNISDHAFNIAYGEGLSSQLTVDSQRILCLKSSPELCRCVTESRLPDISRIEWLEFAGKKLPKLFPVSQREGGSAFDFDIVATTFMLTSDFQDLISTERDEFDRLRAMDSLQDRLGILDFPVVNYYSLLIKQKLEEFFSINIGSKEFCGADCGLALTHDVDYTSSLNFKIIKRNVFGHAVLNKEGLSSGERARKLLYPVLALIGYDPPRKGMYFLRDAEMEFGLNSTFFVKTGETSREDVNYNYRSSRMRQFLASLGDSGFEIGIHPSMKTYIDAEQFVTEKNRLQEILQREIKSVRQHYLKFTASRTVGIWEGAGIRFDSTLGFSRKPGFRNSVGFPYPLYDFKQDRISKVTELPLILMDGTIAENRRLTTGQAFEKMKELIHETKKANGAASILFHNSIADPIDFPGYKKIYIDLLADAKNNGFALSTLSGIVENFN